MLNKIKNILILIRPKHYAKNLFIFLPLFFGGQITNWLLLEKTIIAFFSFSLAASAIYIINDLNDIEDDQLHPKKRFRPLAAGTITKNDATLTIFILLFVSLLLSFSVSLKLMLIILSYLVLNFAYSFRLKHIALLDITIIAVGFVLRLFAGSVVTEVPLSQWIVIMTFLLALFLALAKRRDDVLLFTLTGQKMRKVIYGYNLTLIDGAMVIMASVIIVSYIMYTASPDVMRRIGTDQLYLTSLFIILGILRYMQITFVENNSGSPTNVFYKDKFLQLTICCWIISFIWLLYF